MKLGKLLPALGATALLMTGTAAMAQDKNHTEVGSLSCDVADGSGFIFGSSKDLTCTFNPVQEGAAEETYTGHINKWGIDIGKTQNVEMSWLVLAPSEDIGEGALEGEYGGLSAEATLGVGIGANAMIGGSEDTIALQPISVSKSNGVNFAVGIGEIVLEKAGS